MTQGITNSLNSVLMRMSVIENDFMALEGLNRQLNNIDPNSSVDSDFQTILDEKIKDKKDEETKKIEELVDAMPIEVQGEIKSENSSNDNPKDKKSQKIEEKIEEIKDAINLKSKIDLKAQTTNIEEIIETYSNKYNVDSDFIKAIIKQESNFNSAATSAKGAMGLMQLMPKTAESLGVVDAYNPNQNVDAGVKYLKGLLERFDNNRELALAAYNAGPTAVKKYGGVPPYKETQNYVNSIMSVYEQLKSAQRSVL